MKVVFFYSSLLALLYFVLSIRTVRLRRVLKIGLGDAGNNQMLRAMRVHSNFSEYVPFSLLLIYFVSESGAPFILIHGLGSFFLAGRLFHAYGVSQTAENGKFRVVGMALTFSVLLICASYLLLFSMGFT